MTVSLLIWCFYRTQQGNLHPMQEKCHHHALFVMRFMNLLTEDRITRLSVSQK